MSNQIQKASLEAVHDVAERFSKHQPISKDDRDAVNKFIDSDMVQGEDAVGTAGADFALIRRGNPETNTPGQDVSTDSYIKSRFGFETLPAFLNYRFGLTPNHTLQKHIDYITGTGTNKENFSSVISRSNINDSYRWLIPEVIMRPVYAGMKQSPSSYLDLISGTDQVNNYEVKVPAFTADSDTIPHERQEGQTIDLGMLKFGEKTVNIKEYSKGIGISDRTAQSLTVNMISVFMMQVGRQWMEAETAEAVRILLNGDVAEDAVTEIGVTTVNTLKDRDVWRVLQKLEELGYPANYVIAQMEQTADLLELPIFRNYEGNKVEGSLNTEGLSFTAPRLRGMSRSTMPAGKLLFGSRLALRRLQFMPMQIENDRDVSKKTGYAYVTASSGFYIAQTDARILVNKASTTIAFPDSMDLQKNTNYLP